MKLRVTLEAETSLIPDLQDCKTVQEVRAVLFTQAEESPIKGLKLVGVDLADKSAPTEGGEKKECFLIFEDHEPVKLVDSMQKFYKHDSHGKTKTWLIFDLE